MDLDVIRPEHTTEARHYTTITGHGFIVRIVISRTSGTSGIDPENNCKAARTHTAFLVPFHRMYVLDYTHLTPDRSPGQCASFLYFF